MQRDAATSMCNVDNNKILYINIKFLLQILLNASFPVVIKRDVTEDLLYCWKRRYRRFLILLEET